MSSTVLSDAGPEHAGPDRARLFLLDLLRIGAGVLIAWHHFALYEPLSDRAAVLAAGAIDWLRDSARVTQVFFVVGGYLTARRLSPQRWDLTAAGRYAAHRYVRLGLPYLAAVLLAVAAAEVARGRLPDSVVGARATWLQLAAHALFLQNVLGYESLSAGLWFVCINFQLGLIYVLLLLWRDRLQPPPPEEAALDARPAATARESDAWDPAALGGLGLSAISLFYCNLDPKWDVWGLYFFPYFFAGAAVHGALEGAAGRKTAGWFLLLCAAAMVYQWRWRLAAALVSAAALYAGGKLLGPARPGVGRAVEYFGRASYSLFLVHFPILLLVATLWVELAWESPAAACCGLAVAFLASLLAMTAFHRWIEAPTAELSRWIKY